ncbi:MAG: hypothetical protein UR69_C0002G0081 [Candidatus Moranbacteria bacterium GW2011_GWE2_35_2-]|nr:MAG: hypothetical protein UR69_C0002G0081 [Candidatus Moranbacteria bacterium GW2011_GWE2_35_2-]KKQ05008.1 MAG: hypothetical protein US15_C0037G0005 [Candidatus Moranbacteria bacterium GW2011_GWF1_36_4]KKQ22570.1 MAG: hypothetical protein US37_C0002G0195 [Candidatus Moranbacteria bacterium GW2011_GWF2_37_11]KKQ28973.1 MAG: hypothetical protein US44_C0004G0017 [Candidatus Moranbacteria bacterium GW2011_GWD1_37_17]KKQ30491.1 MAG: hypothetical protein US47_C0002G0081 [Candidatus Moranbacteria b
MINVLIIGEEINLIWSFFGSKKNLNKQHQKGELYILDDDGWINWKKAHNIHFCGYNYESNTAVINNKYRQQIKVDAYLFLSDEENPSKLMFSKKTNG